jgi:hypothetical protein
MKHFLDVLTRYGGAVGAWAVLFALVGNLIVNAIVIQSTKDAMRNNREIAGKTNAFLLRIEDRQEKVEQEQANRLAIVPAYLKAVEALEAERKRLPDAAGQKPSPEPAVSPGAAHPLPSP